MTEATLIILILLTLAVVATLYFRFKKAQPNDAISVALQNLTQTVQATHTQAAVLSEKVERIEQLPSLIGTLQVDLRGVSERLSTVEQKQTTVTGGVTSLQMSLTQATTITNTLVDTTKAIHDDLAKAQEGLTQIQTNAKAREGLERGSAESIKRLETIIAGTQTKGSAGENILELVFSQLPVEWQVRNFIVANKTVEFGLRLPNNMILPIDSKWAATALLDKFAASNSHAVLAKAKEIKKYLDPSLTVDFGVAAIPDAVFELSSGILTQVFQLNVVLISYSMFVPYLLLVFQTVLKTSQHIDFDKLSSYLQNAQRSLGALQDELQGRFSRAITMLSNSRDEMTVYVAKISSGLTALQIGPGEQPPTNSTS